MHFSEFSTRYEKCIMKKHLTRIRDVITVVSFDIDRKFNVIEFEKFYFS